MFKELGIQPPKGVLMYGPPGTGKTLMARACAAQTNSCFLKLAGPQLVQMFIGDGAKLVRDAFALAKEKQPAIIFIDELDAIGTKRFDSEKAGDREVQRTMLELLNQLDGFSSVDDIKVIAATNRVDISEPTPRRPSWPDGPCSTPPPPARWPSMPSRLPSATVVSRPTDSPRPRLPRCSTRLNPLVANSTTANSPAYCRADPTSRFSFLLVTETVE